MLKKVSIFILTTLIFAPIGTIYASDKLYLGGDSIGIQVNYEGVFVSGTYTFQVDGNTFDPSDRIMAKDLIIEVNKTKVSTLAQLYQEFNKFQEKKNEIPIVISRNNQRISTQLLSVYDEKENTFKSGIYVKDRIVGVGTMTYYDAQNHTYGALGHEVMDNDIKEIAPINNGSYYPAFVTSITKAQQNVPGEKHADIDYSKQLGNISLNTNIGIYGSYEELPKDAQALPWAKQSQIKLGKANIYTVLEGDKIETFEIEITKLNKQDSLDVKGIEFQVKDERLKAQTSGIIQGMSGSPIVQDSSIIGAVTHVITNDPMNGYGCYIEWMLTKSSNVN